VDPDERRPFLEKLLSKGTVRNVEFKIRTKDGQIRTTLGSAEVIEVEGESCILSVFADITQRKQAEEALSTMSRRLIGAQEQERTRIARELHDDINQRIAMLSVEFGRLEQSEPPLGLEHRSRLKELQKRLLDLGIEVQAISHRLHSSKLEYLGLAVACKGFCREVAERQEVTVDFTATDVPRKVPEDVALCLFRVLQESLNNAIKYSGVQHFEVWLYGVSDEIQLIVRDDGVGFDAESAMSSQGLGLISMRERVHLVNGTISITSKPRVGTEVAVRVPFVSAETATEMATGAA
jgi:signal transduction histidine kinase